MKQIDIWNLNPDDFEKLFDDAARYQDCEHFKKLKRTRRLGCSTRNCIDGSKFKRRGEVGE